jgi:hypothetical protein
MLCSAEEEEEVGRRSFGGFQLRILGCGSSTTLDHHRYRRYHHGLWKS